MPTRIQQAEALLTAFDWDVAHCRQVRDLALTLFDQLQTLHGLGRDERDILNAAALLHDIGWTISGAKHHKHTYRLIHESKRSLTGFSPTQVELIANVARYHRKALPSLKHEPFAALASKDQEIVRALAGILRVADGLDRPHLQLVRKVECHIGTDRVHIHIHAQAEISAHIDGANRKRDLFESVFGCALAVEGIALASATD
ncbi:MAG: Guanosine-5'-triphosphate,3'-diphosphate pyrophosphatase [Verrucomicrobiae bacterium]|nr:Guanosine-5'-triphosphate,3'-diphosphate pyrophosphatase [Verrucomicrobiae bacterium]